MDVWQSVNQFFDGKVWHVWVFAFMFIIPIFSTRPLSTALRG